MAHGLAMNGLNSKVKSIYGIGTLVVWDMVSISLAKNKDLLPDYLPRTTSDDILSALAKVNSREANYPSYTIVSPYPPEAFQKQLVKDWLKLIITYPRAYLMHRAHLFGVLLGVFDREIYYPYHPGIDKNEFGITFENINDKERDKYFQLFDKSSNFIIYRPWIYFLLGVCVVLVSARRLLTKNDNKEINLLAFTVAFSGLVSAASLLIIATAADYRYMTWTILSALLSTALLSAKGDSNMKDS
jgi:hypothetical protein